VIVVPLGLYIAFRLFAAEDILSLNLKESPDARKRELDKYV
jgi:hypothetical protein